MDPTGVFRAASAVGVGGAVVMIGLSGMSPERAARLTCLVSPMLSCS